MRSIQGCHTSVLAPDAVSSAKRLVCAASSSLASSDPSHYSFIFFINSFPMVQKDAISVIGPRIRPHAGQKYFSVCLNAIDQPSIVKRTVQRQNRPSPQYSPYFPDPTGPRGPEFSLDETTDTPMRVSLNSVNLSASTSKFLLVPRVNRQRPSQVRHQC